jgi:hypothetical protein
MSFKGECKSCLAALEQLEETIVLPEPQKSEVINNQYRIGSYIMTKELDGELYVNRSTYTKLDTYHDETEPSLHDDVTIEEYIVPFLKGQTDALQVIDDSIKSGKYWVNGTFTAMKDEPELEKSYLAFADVQDVQVIKDV